VSRPGFENPINVPDLFLKDHQWFGGHNASAWLHVDGCPPGGFSAGVPMELQ
jgi:hypothetical protein